MPIKIVPLGDKLCVDLAPKEEISSGGILIPEIAQEEARVGTVMAVGPGKAGPDGVRIRPLPQVGDTVLVSKYGLQVVKVGGRDYYFTSEDSIHAILYTEDEPVYEAEYSEEGVRLHREDSFDPTDKHHPGAPLW